MPRGFTSTELARYAAELVAGLRGNGFRVLGLDAGASQATVLERAGDIAVRVDIEGEAGYPVDFPVLAAPDRTREAVAASVQRLGDPMRRLLDEALWFRLADAIDAGAAFRLREGNVGAACHLWQSATARASEPAMPLHRQHSLAVLRLWMAVMPAKSTLVTVEEWRATVEAWAPILRADAFWGALVSRSPVAMDPRCPPSTAQEIRRVVGDALAGAVARLATAMLEGDHPEDASSWFALLATGELPEQFARPAMGGVFEVVHGLIQPHVAALDAALRADPPEQDAVVALVASLDAVRSVFEGCRDIAGTLVPGCEAPGDRLANAYRGVAWYYRSSAQDSAAALDAMETAGRLAISEGIDAAAFPCAARSGRTWA